ncbi:MAG TPA: hypothetical protein VNU66_11385 [Mycobacteriales bacterium]|nr:hypothetical protein [Mycobacteriales bacterium]
MTTTTDRPARPAPRRAGLVLTGVLHLAVLWPYSASGLLAPGWAVVALLLLWAALGAAAVVVHRRWGVLSALVPLAALGLWFGALVLGEQLLGWTA